MKSLYCIFQLSNIIITDKIVRNYVFMKCAKYANLKSENINICLLRKKLPSREKSSGTIGPHNINNFTFGREGDEAQKIYQGPYKKALICNEGQKCEIEDIMVVVNFPR